MPRHLKPTGRRLAVLVVAVAVAAGVAAIVVRNVNRGSRTAIEPHCVAGPGAADRTAASYTMDLEQAANASTISAIGKRLGLPDHAVTVALAAALQESKLRNVGHGDLDSLGLFQQRPSQGWGTKAQVMDPDYATATFFQHLSKVKGWETMAVADAAQQVQRSASGDAYAQWEAEARLLAAALTGELPAGLACRFDATNTAATGAPSLPSVMTAELGQPGLGVSVDSARGWTMSGWLVGHAARYRIDSVSFSGRTWTPTAGTWTADPASGNQVVIHTLPGPR